MAGVQGGFTDVSHNPSSNTQQYYSSADNGVRANTYNVNRNEGNSSWFQKIGTKQVLIGVGIAVAIIVIVLVIVLPIVLTRKSSSTGNPTIQTTASTPQSFITKCQSTVSKSFIKNVEVPTVKNQNNKVKMLPAPKKVGDRILIENTYIVEFPLGSDVTNRFGSITKSLKASHDIDSSKVKERCTIQSSLFSGVSFTVNDNHPIEAIEIIKDAIAIYPVYLIPGPKPVKTTFIYDTLYGSGADSINSYNMTGINQVQNNFNNFGAGVRVAVIDSGVYYKHPALGGCFGPGCKVAFGYDFIGDDFGPHSQVIAPDNDPIDNCSDSSHGTHVTGIIAANATGITETGFISYVPFVGVAPQVTIGAYRVFSCSGSTASDIITQAIYRAYNDKADIINLSLGGPGPYPESPDSRAVQRVSDAGVYVVVSAGNSGDGGLQTTGDPSNSPGVMSIGSIDNKYNLSTDNSIIIGPDGKNILYQPGSVYGGWQSIVNLTIVVNDPNRTVSDGCSGPSKSVFGAVVLFSYNTNDLCTSAVRCNLAAAEGAAGCLLYNVIGITGATNIPSGSISLSDGLDIVAKIVANNSNVYTFTNLVATTTLNTEGTPSDFSSFGFTGDLFLKPQISGIGGNVYSTISPYVASISNSPRMYAFLSGTSMACPYVAGTLALFLANIGNPSPDTASGISNNGICRPPFSMAMNIFQSTAQSVNNYNSTFVATTVKQGAGLVDIYHAITATTMISPSELSLNDTVRKSSSYTVKVYNIGTKMASYKVSHVGAALATGKTSTDDQLLGTPSYSADYANVTIEPTEFDLQPEQSRNITLQFSPPSRANSDLLPVYSGFIYVTNQINGEVVHLSYAGMVGDYENARIIVRSTAANMTTGIQNPLDSYTIYKDGMDLNATEGISIYSVLAWSTRAYLVEVVSINDTSLPGSNSSFGIPISSTDGSLLLRINVPRNTVADTQTFSQVDVTSWDGYVCPDIFNAGCSSNYITLLDPGEYRLRFSAAKHFGDFSNFTDCEVYRSPIFNLVY